MPTEKAPKKPKKKAPVRRFSRERSLVWVDQAPLRRKAASECGRAMERLEKARAEWRRFEREDQPAYRRWVASTFGAAMSRIRELESLLREKERLVQEVEQEMFFSGSNSYRAAYTRVQKRRNNPEPEPESAPPPLEEDKSEDSSDEDEELDEFAATLMFEEFVRTFLGMNPDRMSDRQYDKMFAEFKANVLGQDRPQGKEQRRPEFEREPDFAPEPPKSQENRVKELYRLLVRRLHPDMKADSNAEVSALWHEVQEAYAGGNVERLEMLLAFTDIQANTAGEHTSLFQMRAVLSELRGAFNALQRTLRQAKKDQAWNFARLEDRSQLEARVRREMESTVAWHEDQLRQLEALIAEWSAPAKRKARPASKMRKADFSF